METIGITPISGILPKPTTEFLDVVPGMQRSVFSRTSTITSQPRLRLSHGTVLAGSENAVSKCGTE